MLVFIDDSGDTGFKFGRGSTRFFVIAMVIFDDELEAEKTAVRIKELKRELKFSDVTEFRFYKTREKYRIEFLKAINPFNFKVRALVVDKQKIYSQELKKNKGKFYSYFIKEALKYSGGDILNAKIKIDGSGDRTFRKNFISYVRRELDKNIMSHCKFSDSKSNVLIQMADMIAGSINRFFNKEKKDHLLYRAIIANHIKNVWEFQ